MKRSSRSTKKQSPSHVSSSFSDSLPLRVPVVGIGASAGGLEAIQSFFESMPSDSGLAFVIIQHLSPDYKSLMVELLSKHTSMKVASVHDGVSVEPNCIYLIPPKKNLTIFHGKLLLSDQERHRGLNLPIDAFFRSLAEELNERSIGIILSGTGSDGTLGIRAIKGAGGLVIVQDEQSAKFDGMPRSAIATGLVDYILSPKAMPEQLVRYLKHPYVSRDHHAASAVTEEEGLPKILSLLRMHVGVDFTFYKPNTITRRIERRMGIHGINSIQEYVNLLQTSAIEKSTLYKELLIGVTRFFRDPEAYESLRVNVLPKLFHPKNTKKSVRIWVVACSTGEEAYSIAILIREYLEANKLPHEFKIFATDLDRDSVESASAGIYPESIAVDVSEERLQQFFQRVGPSYQVQESIRRSVVFASHNITKDPPFSKIDLVTCRNMLIYLQPLIQQKVLLALRFSLIADGFLLLGSSETTGDMNEYFDVVDSKNRVYSCSSAVRPVNVGFFTPASVRKIDDSIPEMLALRDHHEREDGIGFVEELLIHDYVPPAILIDSAYTMLHVFGDVTPFLRMPSGKVNLNVLKMIPEETGIPLSAAIRRALKEKKSVALRRVPVTIAGKKHIVDMTVRPIVEPKKRREYLLIMFDHLQGAKREKPTEELTASGTLNAQINTLEQELQYSKETLQATIEELESANEELQSTNEELVASNEELQSTNEELQSVNEELYTVNAEYQKKIEELSELNDDIANWFNVTHVGTVFLDLKLRIRKYTPAVLHTLNIIPTDVGRPLNHISHMLDYPGFHADVESVLESLQHKETDVQRKDGAWLNVRILPYRSSENAVKGLIVTFFDISRVKSVEGELSREKELLVRVLENSPIGQLVVEQGGRITLVNKRCAEMLGSPVAELKKLSYGTSLRCEPIDLPPDAGACPVLRIFDLKTPVVGMKARLLVREREAAVAIVSAAPVFHEDGSVAEIVISLHPMSTEKG